jgi:hypothetical protein
MICKGQQDYFYSDTTYHVGSELIDGGQAKNSMFCQVRVGYKGVKTYTPFEVSEYGFKGGRVYLSRDVVVKNSLKRVFLERLVQGKMTLYFYRGDEGRYFYLETDSGKLLPLGKEKSAEGHPQYRETLREKTSDCRPAQASTDLIIFRQGSLTKLVEAYNKCETREIPYWKFGFTFGYVNTTLKVPDGVTLSFLQGSSIESDGSMTAGIFFENPLGKSGLSVHYELQYARNNYSYYRYLTNQYYMVINTSCINIPVLLRYTLGGAGSRIHPYVNAGMQAAITMQKDSEVMEDEMDGRVVVAETFYKSELMGNQYLGYVAGAGLSVKIHHRMNFYTEVRYTGSYAFSQPTCLDKRELFLLTGISF